MCGIFGYVGSKTSSADIVLTGLKKLEYRGYDSWGVAVAEDNHAVVKKKAGKIGGASVSSLPPATIGLGHTRWATHGGVTDGNAHPHVDCSGRLALVHNGIIENYEEIKKELAASGHTFVSQTDTEVAVHLIEENLKTNSLLEAVRKSFLRFEGLNAIIVMDGQTQTFIAAKNGSPLVIGFGKNENFLASDAPALLVHTRKVYFMEDFDVVEETKDAITVYDARTGEEKKITTQHLDWKEEQVEKGPYQHFMMKEIMEQPMVLETILQSSTKEISALAASIGKAYGTYFTGCGTAAYAALAGTYLFSTIAKRHVNFAIGSEFGYLTNFLTDKSLVLALSQSGETIDIIETISKAKKKGATIASLLNVFGSTLYRESDMHVLLRAGPEKAVASTKVFCAMLTVLILVAYALTDDGETGSARIQQAAKEIKHILTPQYQEKIKSLADRLLKSTDMYLIGRGLSYPLVLEAALKIKEVSYIHAEGFAAGELKHGPIALIEKGTPCIVYAPNDETHGANLAGAMEMKARGAYIIGISNKPAEVFDVFFEVADCGPATIIPNVVVAQLLAYYLALGKGNDPDMPRNLAKSVTVK